MDEKQAQLLRDSLEASLAVLETLPRIIVQIQGNLAKVKEMIAEGRNPTEEELQEQSERLKAQTATLEQAANASRAAAPPTG